MTAPVLLGYALLYLGLALLIANRLHAWRKQHPRRGR